MSKKELTRREFLSKAIEKSVQIAAASTIGGALISGCNEKKLPEKKVRTKALVIGSGFGGAVAALRLSESGVETIVLERGRRWTVSPQGNTFPTFAHPDRRCSWLATTPVYPGSPPAVFQPYTGLIDQHKGNGMTVVYGAGVGGSSLVYGGVMLQPEKSIFERVFPRELSYDELDRYYYPRVREVISPAVLPQDLLNSQAYAATKVFLEDARRSSFSERLSDSATNWSIVRDELQGRATPSASIGEYLYGTNSGAKSSVDKNYLARAEASGKVDVRPLHVVKDVKEEGGTYLVLCDHIDENGTPFERVIFSCDYLFFGAGSMGTSELLVKAKAKSYLPRLSDDVGRYWGNNGDRLMLRSALPHITRTHQGGPAAAIAFHHDNSISPVTLVHGPTPFQVQDRLMVILGMGLPEPRGYFTYDARTDQCKLNWPTESESTSIAAVRHSLTLMMQTSGGLLMDISDVYGASTYHPLGGAVMNRACDLDGRVKGYRNLFVVDGALIPGSAACSNPALTIAAIAERCMDKILQSDLRA